jgi:hypothetical protein
MARQKTEAKAKVKSKEVKQETSEIITDILQEFFIQDGIEMIKKIYMSKDKVIKEEIIRS